MPRYDARRIESKWQAFWDEHQTFRTEMDPAKPKLYVLDMFPYPSGEGLHVGHPEGYTATDIVCRFSRMRGKNVLHPMGWDAFGLPAEEHAVKTGTHPAVTTKTNINRFREQLKMLGFSYDWSREISTTDPEYYRWTQWIFLELFDTWYDPDFAWTGPDGKARTGKGRPISELSIPADIAQQGEVAVRRYQDRHRLAYQHEAPVNWCPKLGTVLANEEVIDGKSEVGGHPVERVPLRQWMLRITAYADRLGSELDDLAWPDSIKALQRNWIGRSEGAEVDFVVDGRWSKVDGQETETSSSSTINHQPSTFDAFSSQREEKGFPLDPEPGVIRVYTTRPDTLFGVTYMVLSPEHPLVDAITTPGQRAAVDAYRKQAALKSDLDRTDLAKEKTGVFTGGHAINPVNGDRVPVWIADYVLASYGTGAIMAVPAHDERDFEFAKTFGLPIKAVVHPTDDWLKQQSAKLVDWLGDVKHTVETGAAKVRGWIESLPVSPLLKQGMEFIEKATQQAKPSVDYLVGAVRQVYLDNAGQFATAFTELGTAINSGLYDGLTTLDFKAKITADLTKKGLGRKAVNYRLRDWLFSRQRYWGEPFPIWHELDSHGQPTGLLRTDAAADLPIILPEMEDFKPTGTPEPLLSKAPESWLYKTAADGTKLKRETNSMPQWAGSCWYYLRFCDPRNDQEFLSPAKGNYWLPVDLYIGGAEHAVLHLLYARFWHKVLFDRGHVSVPEPFGRLVNQGMILGEMEFRAYQTADESGGYVSLREVDEESQATRDGKSVSSVKLNADQVEKQGDAWVLKDSPAVVVDARSFKMSKSRGNVVNPDDVVKEYGADALRIYEMFMGPLEATKPWSTTGVEGVYRFLGRAWRLFVDDKADDVALSSAVQDVPATEDQLRILHKTIKAVTEDIEKLSFNTAISRMMEFTNEFTSYDVRPKSSLREFVLLLSPFAPHLAEELWELLGHSRSLAYEPWPTFDAALLEESVLEIPVQVNGKVRGKIRVAKDATKETIITLGQEETNVASHLEGKTIVKTIYVPEKLLNFVVK